MGEWRGPSRTLIADDGGAQYFHGAVVKVRAARVPGTAKRDTDSFLRARRRLISLFQFEAIG
jgi:hypothetical protein